MKIKTPNNRALICLSLAVLCLAPCLQGAEYKTVSDVPYYEESVRRQDAYVAERCVLDVYYPADAKNFATVVWFHGGGLTKGKKSVPTQLARQGFCVVAANYRLSPKVTCPKYIEDAAAAVAWVFKNIAAYGGNPDLIFVSGHSAGGYLASMIGLDKSWLNARGVDADKIAALIPLSGQAITHYTIRKERGIADTRPVVDEYAPQYHVRRDCPPYIMMTGDRELELLGRYEENAYMLRMMKIVQHPRVVLYEFDGYGHGMLAPAFPLMIKFIKERVKEINK
jgi:acetyl esterase/lipase